VSILSLSPDGRWAAVRLTRLSHTAAPQDQVFLAPFGDGNLAPPSQWIPVPARVASSWVKWSLDGGALYYFADATGDYSVEALPLDPATQRVRGPKQILRSFDRPSFLLLKQAGLAPVSGGVIISASESKGNIWLMKLP
jgi:hypothetical protein